MEKQKTISREVSLEGIGLHTGNTSKIVFKPALPNSGIRFVRTDLPERPVIPATQEFVQGGLRGTTIGINSSRVHTIEHILAVCSSFGIDNMDIEITNNEPPVMDGSARAFAEVLTTAGLVEQDAERRYLTITSPVVYEAGKTRIAAYPADSFTIDCTIGFDHPLLKHQQTSFEVTREVFLKEIAAARTFCFDYEIEALQSKGLAKGGNLTNAIVLGLGGIHNPEKLRFPDEFVRHKMLDLIGDLYLAGMPIKGRIVADRCGHNHNVSFVKELIKNNCQ